MQRQSFYLSLFAAVLAMTWASLGAQAQSLANVELDGAGGMAGVPIYSQDQWGLVRSTITNRSDATQTPLVVHAVGERQHIQFGHRVWVPANSRRTQLTPVMPLADAADGRAYELQTWLIDDSGGRERSGPPDEGLLLAARGAFQLGVMTDRDDASLGDVVAALRAAAGHGRGSAYIGDSAAPSLPAAWGALDVLALARTPDLSAAQVDALRQWVIGGGRLWVMLDQVDPAFVERLLGDAWNVAVVDDVWLEGVSITQPPAGQTYDFEREAGIAMRRVHAPGMTVTHEAAGYPAAAWQRVGRGRVMMTTVHADAWLQPGVDEEGGETRVAAPPLEALAWFFDDDHQVVARTNELVHEAMAGQARAQIGYSIISRMPVFLTLGLFAVLLLVAGAVLLRRDRLEWVGVAGVGLAVVTSAALVGMGKMRQSDHEMTLAAADLVEPTAGQPYASVRGTFQVFRPDHAAGQVTFAGPGDAIAFPADARRASERIRMVWHGLDRWTLPDLTLAAGAARRFTHDRAVMLDRPLTASARLTETGLAGQVHGGDGASFDDALIAMPHGRMATRVSDDGTFDASLDDQLVGDQYIHAAAMGTLSQTQMRRQQAYRRLLGTGAYPDEPTLLAWTDAEPSAVMMSEQATRRGQWLLALPLRFEQPTAGERVTVPAPLMRMRPYRDAPGVAGATVYDEQNGEWIRPISQPTTLFMRFQPPENLRAIAVDGAVLELDLDAPGWRYEVLRVHDNEVQVVDEGHSPNGRLSIDLDESQAPAMVDGGVAIGLRLEPIPGSAGQGWSLYHMDLSVRGVAR